MPPAHLVRYGMNDSDPVALCINKDGSGVANYPQKGITYVLASRLHVLMGSSRSWPTTARAAWH